MDLKNWKLTLDIEDPKTKEVMEIPPPCLSTFEHPHFSRTGESIKFTANCGGRTTKGTKYPRSELREMKDGKLASWSIGEGVHEMKWICSVGHLPKIKSQVVVGQIHDDKDDVIEIRHSDGFVEVIHDEKHYGKLIPHYRLGDKYSASITAKNGVIAIFSGNTTILIKSKAKNCYFKMGAYVQANTSTDAPMDYGEVTVYSLSVNHQ